MKLIKGGVTKPKGIRANGLPCGIKHSGKPDLALIASDVPCVCAGVFTKNSIKAAPVVVSKKHIRNNKAQGIIVNSGNANCFTGSFGLIYANRTAQLFGTLLNVDANDLIVASTGIIGKPLPYTKIQKAAKRLVNGLSKNGGQKAAKAILTTDKRIKEIAVELTLSGKKVTIGACAKGSGMIAPDMATMLSFITTDAAINAKMLKLALKNAVDESFNCITIDGCMSTNDMVTALANGLADNKTIAKPGKEFNKFSDALKFVCDNLCQKMISDAEGATKFIKINVKGAETHKQARKIGLAIANSNLVKTAAFGNNPNWGRIASAAGSLAIKKIHENDLKISFSPFSKKNISIGVDLNIGNENAIVYTSDLSYEYVKINVEYN